MSAGTMTSKRWVWLKPSVRQLREMTAKWIVAKNAVANLARGGAAGLVALLLPPILVRHMTQIEYAVWILALQIAAYCAYLDCGLQTAVGRYIAFARERHDDQTRDSIYSTAMVGLLLAALICFILLCIVASAAGWLFPQFPTSTRTAIKAVLLIVGFSTALGLPASAWTGVFIGLERNEIPAVIMGGSKIVCALALIAAVLRGHSIVSMAVLLALFNLASYLALFVAARISAPEIRFRRTFVTWLTAKELSGYCYGLLIWSFSMVLITGVDLILVARFQVSALAPYGVVATLVTFLAGAQSAIFTAMMPRAAVMHAQQDAVGLGKMVLRATRLAVFLLVITGMPLIIFAEPILNAWVGPQYAYSGHVFLIVLVVANMLRLTGLPYSVILIGTAQQKAVKVTPIAEGVTNLIASLLLGIKFGALGVAFGTLIGAFVGVCGNVFYNIRRTSDEISVRIRDYLVAGLLIPSLLTIPFLAFGSRNRNFITVAAILALIVVAILAVRAAVHLRSGQVWQQD